MQFWAWEYFYWSVRVTRWTALWTSDATRSSWQNQCCGRWNWCGERFFYHSAFIITCRWHSGVIHTILILPEAFNSMPASCHPCILNPVNLIIVRQNDVILGHIFMEFHVAQFDYTMISWEFKWHFVVVYSARRWAICYPICMFNHWYPEFQHQICASKHWMSLVIQGLILVLGDSILLWHV